MTLVSCFPQFVVLLVGELESDLSRLALHHHVENVLILQSLAIAGATYELDHGLVCIESSLA